MDNFRDSYFNVTWDLTKKHLRGTFWGKQYDTGRGFAVTIVEGGQVTVPSTETVRLKWEKPDSTEGYVTAVVVDDKFLIEDIDQMFTVHGAVRSDLEIWRGGKVISSITFYVSVEKAVAVDAIESSSDFTALQEALADVGDMQAQVDAVIANATVDSEVILARGTEPTLGARLDSTDAQLNETASKFTVGKNMFDKTKRTLGMYMPIGSGVPGANAAYDVSDYIKIFASQSYTISKAASYCLFGTDKVYIKGVNGGGSFTPTQDGYMRFNLLKTDVDSAQVEKGLTNTAYEPYGTEVINLSINDKSISPLKLMDNVRFDAYPFQPLANFNANLTAELEIKKAIKIIELFGADNSKKYCLGIIQRNYQSYGTGAYIYECNSDGSANKIVSLTSKLTHIPPTGIDVFTLAEFQSSGISAKIYIDWSQITDGTQYVNTHYDKAGLDYRVYKQNTTGDTAKIKLPPTIPAIVGKEINVYFDNVILADNLADYKIEVSCDIGKHQNERWTVIPSVVGTYPLSISLYKNGELITSATSSVIVKSTNVGNGVTKKALFIGDSTTDAGVYTGELVNNLFGSDVMNLELLGTRGTSPNLHEGRSGWRASNYLNDASASGVTNAFWNPNTSAFDFAYYMTQQAYTNVDMVGINLGVNDMFGYTDDTSALAEITNVLNRFDTMLNSVKSYNANTKVAFLVTIPPSKNQDAFGNDYGNGQSQWRYRRNNFLFVEKLIDKYKNREGEGIYLVPVNVNLDTENNMMTETVQVNSRNTETVVRQSNGVHPDPMGYKQMSDVIYYWLKSFEV